MVVPAQKSAGNDPAPLAPPAPPAPPSNPAPPNNPAPNNPAPPASNNPAPSIVAVNNSVSVLPNPESNAGVNLVPMVDFERNYYDQWRWH